MRDLKNIQLGESIALYNWDGKAIALHPVTEDGDIIALCTNEGTAEWIAKAASAPELLAERDELLEEKAQLVAALQGVIRVADRKTVEFDAARAAVARATKSI